MDIDAVLAQVQNVNVDIFIGVLAWHVASGKPITPAVWKESADLSNVK